MAIEKRFKNVRTAVVKSGTGKLRGRHCVSVQTDKAPRSAVKGVKLAAIQFHGCYLSKNDAYRAAEKLSKRRSL